MPKLKIDLDKGGESFYVYKINVTATSPELLDKFEGEEGKGPWYLCDEEAAVGAVDNYNEYEGVLASIEPIQVWL